MNVVLEAGSDHRAIQCRPLQSQRKIARSGGACIRKRKIFVTLEVDAIVLPLACRGVYSKVPVLPSSTSGWKINGVMNLTTLLLYFTSGAFGKTEQQPKTTNNRDCRVWCRCRVFGTPQSGAVLAFRYGGTNSDTGRVRQAPGEHISRLFEPAQILIRKLSDA